MPRAEKGSAQGGAQKTGQRGNGKTIWLPPGLQLTTTDLKIEKGSAQGGAPKNWLKRSPLLLQQPGISDQRALAMATRCFCPPDSCVPFSPTLVLYL